jgi:PAS domain S-box-containing protein
MIKKYFTLIAAISISLIVLVSVISFLTVNTINRERLLKDQEFENLFLTNKIFDDILNTETGQRGYIITGKDEYLNDYNLGLSTLNSPEIQDFYNKEKLKPGLSDKIFKLQFLLQKKFNELQHTINLRKSGGFEAAQKVVNENTGKELMDEIRTVVNEVQKQQRINLTHQEDQIVQHVTLLLRVMWLGNVLALFIIGIIFYFLYKYLQKISQNEITITNLNEQYQAIFNSTSQAIITLNFDGTILSCNQGATNLFGYSPEEMINQSIRMIYEGADNTQHLEEMSKLYSAQFSTPFDFFLYMLNRNILHHETVWSAKRKDGTTFELSRTYTSLKDTYGKFRGILFVGADVTARQRYEEALKLAKQEAENASRIKTRFLRNMSHDLRTPLNSIIGFSNILLKNKSHNLNEQEISHLKRVYDNGIHLLNLINSILDLSKIEEGKMEVHITEFDLEDFIQKIIKNIDVPIEEKKFNLITEIPEQMSPIRSDPQILLQILNNLIGNAIKFTEKGYVKIHVLKSDKTNVPVQIDIIDTGPGIDQSRLEHIFEPFQLRYAEERSKYGSTGLGLSIALSLCNLLGYELLVKSEVGKGSTFTIILNDQSTQTPTLKISAEPLLEEQNETNHLPTKTVLVIDDEEEARFLLSHYFKNLGCQVITAASGAEGLKIAKETSLDLITIDIKMAPMDGYQVMQVMHNDAKLRNIPIAIISVCAEEAQGKIEGIKAYLNKPVSFEDLKSLI